MRVPIVCYSLIVIVFLSFGCKKRYGDEHRDLSLFERLAHEYTDDEVMEDFIDSLLLRLTLVEKVGQMTQLNEAYFGFDEDSDVEAGGQAGMIDTAKLAQTIRKYQIGSFLTGGARTARVWYDISYQVQEINLSNSRTKIPIITGIDHVHGPNFLTEGTIFPHQINIGATFNEQFAYDMGRITSLETAHIGHHWNFAPVLGVGLKKNWSRLYETFGEDTYLASVMGAQYIKGLQEAQSGEYRMAACAKHFIGYSVPDTGWDRTDANIPPQKLYEYLVPPFEAAIKSGALTVMVNSGAINGIPVHTSYHYLTTLLRDELGFEGVVVTDWADIKKLNEQHFVTENEKESTYKAIIAGIDMSMTPTTIDFCDHLLELIEEGRIPEERIDLSVKRILRLKYKLGLFNNPYPTQRYINNIGSQEFQKAALDAAAESIVLLKNERRLLPLNRPNRLTVIGTNADSKMALCGGWTYSWQGDDESLYSDSIETVYGALDAEFENTRVTLSDRAHLRYYAGISDAVIIVTGEKPYTEGFGTIDNMELPVEEIELIEAAIATKKPVILILLEGRPRILGELFDQCHAVIFAGLPGIFGGEAIAGILSGRFNPSAKMSITYPYQTGHMIPYNHDHMVFSDMNINNPDNQRFTIGAFGTGLSYTQYSYSDLTMSDTILTNGDKLKVSVKVKNTGSREGKETVLWYLADEVGSISRPVKQLKYFEKQFLLPGEMKEFIFTIDPDTHLSYPDEKGRKIFEDGYFKIIVGTLESRFQFVSDN
jgi:beta-glucosidase